MEFSRAKVIECPVTPRITDCPHICFVAEWVTSYSWTAPYDVSSVAWSPIASTSLHRMARGLRAARVGDLVECYRVIGEGVYGRAPSYDSDASRALCVSQRQGYRCWWPVMSGAPTGLCATAAVPRVSACRLLTPCTASAYRASCRAGSDVSVTVKPRARGHQSLHGREN